MEPVPLGNALKESLDQLEVDLKSRNAEVRIVGDGLPAVRANRTLFCRVIANLVANESKASPAGSG